jgi:hypothetical protein
VAEVTNVSGLTVTLVRGRDGTSGVAHNSGATVKHGVSARDFDEPNAHVNTGSGAHSLDAALWTADLGAWTSFTPTLSGWTQGNGTVVAKYSQIGRVVSFSIVITGGTTSSGNIASFTLPVTAADSNTSGALRTNDGGYAHLGAFIGSSTTVATIGRTSTTGLIDTSVTATGASATVHISGTYEAA